MGKANILQNLGSGQYRIQPLFDTARATALMSQLTARAKDIADSTIPATESAISEANSAANAAYNNLQRVIRQSPDDSVLSAATESLAAANTTLNQLQNSLASSKLLLRSVNDKLSLLSKLQLQEPIDVWCADCSRGLTGEVGTIELYGLATHTLIKPSSASTSTSDSDAYRAAHASAYAPSDGLFSHTAYLTPEATFYNAAMFPAWQKWKPTYRAADITNIYGDLCSVTIYDPRTTTEQGTISVDDAIDFVGVPFNVKSYTSANFAIGDRIILRFVDQDYTNPEVYGFYQSPCTTTSYTTTTSTSTTTLTTSTSSSSSSSTTSTSSTISSTTSCTLPPTIWFTIQGESAPFQLDGAFYHFTGMEFDSEDLDHTDPPSPYGVAIYTGLSYTPTGYWSLARNILIKYDGDSNQTILTSGSYGTQYNDITYDIPNARFIGTSFAQTNNIYFFQGTTLTQDTVVTVADPSDLKPATTSQLGGITCDSGTLLVTQWYTRNDGILVYRLLRIDYTGSILVDYQTHVISSDNISNLCMSNGNTGTLIALAINKTVDVYDSGLANPPTTYSISHLPCTTAPAGIVTNVLHT